MASLSVGFEQLQLTEIVVFTAVHNRRSRSVMEKIGMHVIDDTFEHPMVPVANPLRRHCLYRLTQAQWRRFRFSES